MKTKNKAWTRLGAALLALAGLASLATRASATNPAFLNIEVAITASKSVQVNGADSSSDTSTNWTGTPNLAVNPASTVTVTNNSGLLSESWELSTDTNSLPSSGAQTWARVNSTTTVGADEFALQAVFGSSATTTCAGASWNDSAIASPLGVTPTLYTSTNYADSALATGGANTYKPDDTVGNTMYAYNAGTGIGARALCWRVILPASTATSATQTIQVIVTAL